LIEVRGVVGFNAIDRQRGAASEQVDGASRHSRATCQGAKLAMMHQKTLQAMAENSVLSMSRRRQGPPLCLLDKQSRRPGKLGRNTPKATRAPHRDLARHQCTGRQKEET
jgi:hypothetical protein